MDVRRVEQVAGAAAHQEFRAAGADRVVAAARAAPARARLSSGNCGSAKISLHICQADAISSASELTQSGIVSDGSRCTSTSICASSRLAQRDAEKIADANVDRHPHAVDGTAQHDAFAMKFDLPHAAIGADILRIEADGQGKRVEPQMRGSTRRD